MAKLDLVLDLLGNDEKGVGYYLHFLNLGFASNPAALARLRTVIPWLEQEPQTWRECVQGTIWRPQLVGCAALLLARNTGYLDALTSSFVHPSFVCPQAAVTFGLLHQDEARLFFERYLRGPSTSGDSKLTGAAYAVLTRLGSPAASEFDIAGFKAHPPQGASVSHWEADCDVGVGVVEGHWDAWTNIMAAESSV